MAVKEILLLGNPALYEICSALRPEESGTINGVVDDMHDTLMDFRERHGAGRAIAAPQIGVMKRLVYMFIKEPLVFINPVIIEKSEETMEVWDDCMSFPGLLVRVKRNRRCRIEYLTRDLKGASLDAEGDLSELLQHEIDHLDGILAVMRAIDKKSLALAGGRNSPLPGIIK